MAAIMNIYKIEDYAKNYVMENGRELKFILTNKSGSIFNGEFLDSHMGLIMIPQIGEGFITLKELKKQIGVDEFNFIPLQD